jgi:hypothetical protein
MARRTEEQFFVFPPPVGAGIHSRSVKGARPVYISGYSYEHTPEISLSNDTLSQRTWLDVTLRFTTIGKYEAALWSVKRV